MPSPPSPRPATPVCPAPTASPPCPSSAASSGAWSGAPCVNGIAIYDDFAHHPTAIATTLAGLRHQVGAARIIALLEPRSNTMRMGVHREQLAPSLAEADAVFLYHPPDLQWDLRAVAAAVGAQGPGSYKHSKI